MLERVALADISRSRHQVVFEFLADRMRFFTSYWYESADLDELEFRFGPDAMERVYFHMAAFEINKICSLRPSALHWGRFSKYVTPAFSELWRTVFTKSWSQWRYENDDPHYAGPDFVDSGSSHLVPIRAEITEEPQILSGFGGGKDGLLAAKVFEELGISYDVLLYTSSIYGLQEPQTALASQLIRKCKPGAVRHQVVFEDFLDSPVLHLGDGVDRTSLMSAETASSLFGAIPYVLTYGYNCLQLAHERSANSGQVIWARTGEQINHQWEKSAEAEALYRAYLGEHLVENLHYFSLLSAVHDPVIFGMLRQYADIMHLVHSCNRRKPWCGRCPKCAYVWLGFTAYLDNSVASATFPCNLFDVEENVPIFRQLLGETDHLPFECVGSADEVKLAFELSISKGWEGRAISYYRANVSRPDVRDSVYRYAGADFSLAAYPQSHSSKFRTTFERGAEATRQYVLNRLLGAPA